MPSKDAALLPLSQLINLSQLKTGIFQPVIDTSGWEVGARSWSIQE